MEKSLQPDYRKIYKDIITRNYPDKRQVCQNILSKKHLSILDVIEVNTLIFNKGNKSSNEMNQKYRSYDIPTILKILDYQKINRLNNTELAIHFKLSRNTVAKWKKQFSV